VFVWCAGNTNVPAVGVLHALGEEGESVQGSTRVRTTSEERGDDDENDGVCVVDAKGLLMGDEG
jgi:hypothetical protein